MNIKRIISKCLREAADNIDAGNSNISEDTALQIIDILNDKPLSKVMACEYLNVSRATFDNEVAAGNIPQGHKEKGFKELRWYKVDLNIFIKAKKAGLPTSVYINKYNKDFNR